MVLLRGKARPTKDLKKGVHKATTYSRVALVAPRLQIDRPALSHVGTIAGGECDTGTRGTMPGKTVKAKSQTVADMADCLTQLRIHFEKVKEDDALFSRKQAASRHSDESYFYEKLTPQEKRDVEQSRLVGHALMLSDMARKNNIPLDKESETLLIAVLNYAVGNFRRT